jgi:hypothetical protein
MIRIFNDIQSTCLPYFAFRSPGHPVLFGKSTDVYLVGGLEHVLCSIIYGMSSFPLTNIFQRGGSTINQLLIWFENGIYGLLYYGI